MSKEHIIIIGGGQAGIQAASHLRSIGYEDRLTVISDETDTPYQRPPLSKDFLKGTIKDQQLGFRPPAFYEKKDIRLHLGDAVTAIDTDRHTVQLASGKTWEWTRLLLATGAHNRRLTLPGTELPGIHYLRTLRESEALKSDLIPGHRLAVIGGGFIGLEIAATARSLGLEVTLLEVADRVMARVVPPAVSQRFEDKHRTEGIDLRLGTAAAAVHTHGKRWTLETADGCSIDADAIVAGIGIVPNDQLAREAGIECADGILVNEYMQTNVADVYAIGDCALHFNPHFGKMIRLESVQNAMDQAKTATEAMMGRLVPYTDVPWFWTYQYEWKFQMAGSGLDADRVVVRPGEAPDHISWFYYKDHRLTGVDSLNRGADHMVAKKLLNAGVTPSPEQAADPRFALKTLLS